MRAILAVVVGLMATACAAGEGGHVAPLDVRSRFADNNCTEIGDFYADRHVEGQPYVYGVASLLSGGKQKSDFSFIAICKSVDTSGYSIISDSLRQNWPGGCVFPIRGVDFFGSLEVKKIKEVARRKGGEAAISSGAFISVERDGLISEYYCASGKWKIISID